MIIYHFQDYSYSPTTSFPDPGNQVGSPMAWGDGFLNMNLRLIRGISLKKYKDALGNYGWAAGILGDPGAASRGEGIIGSTVF